MQQHEQRQMLVPHGRMQRLPAQEAAPDRPAQTGRPKQGSGTFLPALAGGAPRLFRPANRRARSVLDSHEAPPLVPILEAVLEIPYQPFACDIARPTRM